MTRDDHRSGTPVATAPTGTATARVFPYNYYNYGTSGWADVDDAALTRTTDTTPTVWYRIGGDRVAYARDGTLTYTFPDHLGSVPAPPAEECVMSLHSGHPPILRVGPHNRWTTVRRSRL